MKFFKNDVNKTNFNFFNKNSFFKIFNENKKIINKYKKTNYYSILKVNKILFNLNSQIKNKLYDF